MKKSVLIACLIMTSCAKPPEKIAAVPNAGPCTDGDRAKLAALYKAQRDAATGDAMGVFLVGVPVSSALGADKEAEIAVLKGRCGDLVKPAAGQPAKKHPAG